MSDARGKTVFGSKIARSSGVRGEMCRRLDSVIGGSTSIALVEQHLGYHGLQISRSDRLAVKAKKQLTDSWG